MSILKPPEQPKPIKENMLPIYREIKTWNLLKSEDSIWNLLEFVRGAWNDTEAGECKIYREFEEEDEERTTIFLNNTYHRPIKEMVFKKIQPFSIEIYLEADEDSDNHQIIIAVNDNLIFKKLCFPSMWIGKDYVDNEKVMSTFDIELVGYNAYIERWHRLKNER